MMSDRVDAVVEAWMGAGPYPRVVLHRWLPELADTLNRLTEETVEQALEGVDDE